MNPDRSRSLRVCTAFVKDESWVGGAASDTSTFAPLCLTDRKIKSRDAPAGIGIPNKYGNPLVPMVMFTVRGPEGGVRKKINPIMATTTQTQINFLDLDFIIQNHCKRFTISSKLQTWSATWLPSLASRAKSGESGRSCNAS